jgi:dimethylhistidine N-methyltransferase
MTGRLFPVHEMSAAADDFRKDALFGLLSPRKHLFPKYLYDERGSELFERICKLEEYYPTRAEVSILDRYSSEISRELGPDVVLIEPGCGSCRKVRHLLAELEAPRAYVPMDIAREVLVEGVRTLAEEQPFLEIRPACGDHGRGLAALEKLLPQKGRRVIFFPGSTIGNFEPQEAQRFLIDCAERVGDGGALLLGFDLVKAVGLLEAAYDDSLGVTAAFNLNLLERLNRELGADFDVTAFRHRAVYNPILRRVEMHLVSTRDQKTRVGDRRVSFREGETIHTESSHKYTLDSMRALTACAGFRLRKAWTDEQEQFCVALFQA